MTNSPPSSSTQLHPPSLRFSTTLFAQILDGISEPIFVKDQEHHWVFVNQALCRWLGCDRNQVLGTSDVTWFAPESIDTIRHQTDIVLDTGQAQTLGTVLRDQKLDHQPVRLKLALVRDDDAKPYVMGTLHPVPMTLPEPAVPSDPSQSWVSNIPVAVYRREASLERPLLMVSPFIEALTGYPASDFMPPAIRTWDSLIHPEDYPEVNNAIGTALKNYQPFTLEYRILHRNGKMRWVYETGHFYCDLQHHGTYFDGVLTDITHRKQTDAELQRLNTELAALVRDRTTALRQSETSLHTILSSAPLIFYALNHEGILTLSEGHGLRSLGVQPGELVGQSVFDLYADYPDLLDAIQQALAGKLTANLVHVADLWFDNRYSPIYNEAGEIIGLTGVALDVTDRILAEQALRKSETRFQRLATNVPGMLHQLQMTPEGVLSFPYVSEACRELFELAPEEMERALDHVHPEDRPRLLQKMLESAQSLSDFNHLWRICTESGKVKWVQGISKPERRPDGNVRWDGVLIDVSDRKHAEEALQASRQRLKLLIQKTPLAVIEWTPAGVIRAWNPAAEAIFGYSYQEALGQSLTLLVPDGSQHEMEVLFQTLLTQDEVVHRVNENVRRDGRTILCEWYNMPLIDAQGNVVGVAALADDITERMQAEKEQAKLLAILESTPDLIAIADAYGRCFYLNRAGRQMMGIRADEEISCHINEFSAASDDPKTGYQALQTVLNQGIWRGETQLSSRNGRTIPISQVIVAHRSDEGSVEFLSTIGRDISERKRAEDELRSSQQRLSLMVQQTPLAVIEWSKDGIVQDWNPSAERIFGYSRKEALGKHASFLVTDEVRPLVDQIFRDLYHQTGGTRSTNSNCTKTGRNIICEWYNTPLVAEDGHVIGITSLVQDITARIQVERDLQQSQAMLRTVIDNIPQRIFWKDLNLTYLGCNQQQADICGLSSPNDIIGKTDFDLPWAQIHAVDYQRSDRHVLETGQPILHQVEVQHQQGGQAAWVDVNIVPLQDAEGQVIGLLGTVADITQRKQTEAALKEREKRFRTLVNNIPGVVYRCTFDHTWTMQFLSDSVIDLTGYPAEDFLYNRDRSFADLMVSNETTTLATEVESAIRERRPYILEYQLRHADGTRRWVYDKGQAVFDEAGHVLYLDGVMFDITDRRQSEEALRRSERRFRDISEAAGEYIWELDFNGIYTFVTDKSKAVKGYWPSQLLGHTPFEFMLPEDISQVQATIRNAVKHKTSFQLEHRDITPEGEIVWELVNGVPLLNDRGDLIGFRGAGLSITERKRVEAALRQSEERLRKHSQALGALVRSKILDEGNLQTALQKILEVVAATMEVSASIWLFNDNDTALYCVDYYDYHTCTHQSGWALEAADCPNYFSSLEAERTRAIENTLTDLRTLELAETYLLPLKINALMDTPIWLGGKMIGLVSLGHTQPNGYDWTIEEISFAGSIADYVTSMMESWERRQTEVALQDSEEALREKAEQLEQTLWELKRTQSQVIQSEKMSSLGQLVAGVAHEINNPVNFIYGNLAHARVYTEDILGLIQLYQRHFPDPPLAIKQEARVIDLPFLMEDLPKLLNSMKVGADRIQQIVASLRTFSRMDEAEMKAVDIHEGIDSTLMILQNRLKAQPERDEIMVTRNYADLPAVECYAGQLNQVFMNILSNAIDALDDAVADNPELQPAIAIQTEIFNQCVQIRIRDNGTGIPEHIRDRLFDPFFTTKPIGKGTGMGLSISYQIITEKHGGTLECIATEGHGTEFIISIPLSQDVVD